MGKIEEYIQIIGADRAEQELARLAGAEQRLGDETQDAGKKGKGAGDDFLSLENILGKVETGAKAMVAGFAGFQIVKAGFAEFLGILKEIEEIQQRLSGQTAEFAKSAQILTRQLEVGQKEGMRIQAALMTAGGLSEQAAQAFGVGADIAFGKDEAGRHRLLESKNLETTKQIAGFVGAAQMDPQAAADLMRFLQKTGQLTSPEQAQMALAQIKGAAGASDAASIGAFISQLLKGGMGYAQAGVSFKDILTAGGQTINVETSGDLAAQSMIDLERVATGAEDKFTKMIEQRAREMGLDSKKLTTAQKIGISRDILSEVDTQEEEDAIRAAMSTERAQRLLKAFRGSNVAASAGVGQAVGGASAADFRSLVEQYKGEVSYQVAAGEAGRKYAEATQGFQTFFRDEVRRWAESEVERGKAGGQIGWGEQLIKSDEALIEERMLAIMKRIIDQLRAEGVTEEELRNVNRVGGALSQGWDPYWGHGDEKILRLAQEIGKVLREYPQVNIGTAYYDEESGRHSPIPVDVSH